MEGRKAGTSRWNSTSRDSNFALGCSGPRLFCAHDSMVSNVDLSLIGEDSLTLVTKGESEPSGRASRWVGSRRAEARSIRGQFRATSQRADQPNITKQKSVKRGAAAPLPPSLGEM
jgi:hypothetical protein